MREEYTSLGLMSGTSGDGVDASIIQSNGISKYKPIKDEYFEYIPYSIQDNNDITSNESISYKEKKRREDIINSKFYIKIYKGKKLITKSNLFNILYPSFQNDININ